MELENIRALATILREEGLHILEYEEGGLRLHLESTGAYAAPTAPVANISEQASFMPVAADPGMDFKDMHMVNAPLVGVFYASSGPDQPPFVKVGDEVKPGDVLCIVEAMKIMNEITAERNGKIVDICVQNGDVVEYGQTLFKLI